MKSKFWLQMGRCFFLIIFLGAFLKPTPAQQIQIRIEGRSAEKAFLYERSGAATVLKDTVPAAGDGLFSFSMKGNTYHTGFYRLLFDKSKGVDFLNDGNDVSIRANVHAVQESLQVITSESNRIYYDFIKLHKRYKSVLEMFLNRSREAETFAQFAQGKGLHVLEEYAEFVKSVVQKNPNTFIVQYVTSAQLPPLLPDALPEQQLEFLRRHALDKVNFNAAWLINSDVFTVKALEYFAYFRDPKLSNEALEKAFMLAVDSLLNKARINEIVYQSVVDYLINGYKDFGFDKKIIDYLVENYVIKDDLCLDGITEALIKKRIDQAKILKIGAVAPNIILPDSVGREVDLSRIDSERLLLVFYASWCPHCKKLLPKINALYMQQKHKTVEVLGVSLDTGREDWLSFTRNNSIGFINVCDLKGGNSKAALDYLLYATPGMFFLDRDKRIISKPVNIEEVQALFQGK